MTGALSTLAALCLCTGVPGTIEDQPATIVLHGNLTELGKAVAPKIAAKVAPVGPGADQLVRRVVVMPFGDAKAGGRATRATVETPKELQSALTSALESEARSKFLVVGPDELKRQLLEANVDASRLVQSDPSALIQTLDKLNLNAVVFGTFEDLETTAKIRVTVVTADDGKPTVIEERTGPDLISRASDPRSRPFKDSRFRVEVFIVEPGREGKGERKLLPLEQYVDSDGPSASGAGSKALPNAYRVLMDRSMRGKNLVLRLTNLGKAKGFMTNESPEKEAHRIQTAVVRVEGRDTFQHEVAGKPKILSLPVEKCGRWIVTAPGDVMRPDSTVPTGYRLVRGNGNGDHSVLDIGGFQQSDDRNWLPFVVTGPREPSAAQLGVTSEMGVISIHSFPERLDGDIPTDNSVPTTLAVEPGHAPIPHPVFPVKVDAYEECEEIIRVFLVEKDDVPPGRAVPVTR